MDQETPFIGPRPFTEADAGIFFGRKNEIVALAAEVVSAQIVLLYAPSGSGKSSLISAGLVPAMRKKGFQVSQERLNTLALGDERAHVDSLCEAIRQSAHQSSAEQPSLLVLDQFEEIIVAVTYAELRTLSETVYSAMAENPMARVVISFREEYLARADALFNKATEASVGNFHLNRLSRRGALEAFVRSLGMVGFQVEPEAGELFLQQLAPPTRRVRSEVEFEPLYLQLLGSQLWSSIENRGSAGTQDADGPSDVHPIVTVADVRRLVDFDQAIEVFFNSTIRHVCASRRVTEKAMRDWIDRELVTPDETRSMVRRQVNETEGLPTSILDDLVTQGLLRTEPRGDDLWLELAHDQLVERIREFNRVWWTGRVYALLRERSTRFDIAMAASRWDMQRWGQSRTTIWSFSTGIRESGLQLSRWYGGWLPFVHKRSNPELDRLALRVFVLTGTLINSAAFLYRFATTSDVPPTLTLTGIEGLDSDAAKRRLQATALNLGRTEQVLAAVNSLTTIAWARVLSRLLTRSVTGAERMERRRWLFVAALFSSDAALTLLRWAVRNGLIENCLNPADAGQIQRAPALGRGEAGLVRRCMSLEDAASWSRDRPVLLVLDWRGGTDTTRWFQRFKNQEVPLYESALRARGATAAWCCRSDVRRRGWRDAVSGIGFPSRGQRTYYMIEGGNVVAWRTVRSNEFPAKLQGDHAGAREPLVGDWDIRLEKRFITILTALIVSSEAAPLPWREFGEGYFKSGLRHRNRRPV